jgi:predicted phosphoribosyltransferase
MHFADRVDGARHLARLLQHYKGRSEAVLLAIPRGGLVTGRVLADELDLPLDILLAKKLGHPFQPEYALGVVNLADEWLDEETVKRDGIPRPWLNQEIARIRETLKRRSEQYRGGEKPIPISGKTAILVDDGIATGRTMASAVRLARKEGAKTVVVAAPVAPPHTVVELRSLADEVQCVFTPSDFFAIGQFYEDFEQLDDDEAIRLLRRKIPS